jgi:hypothetical protein
MGVEMGALNPNKHIMLNFNKQLVAVTVALLVCFGFYSLTHQQPMSKLGDGVNISANFTIPTQNSVTVGSSTLIVATSTSRNYLLISNDSSNVVYLGIGSQAVIGKGVRVPVNGSYEMKLTTGLFTAAIYGVSLASSSVSYVESTK